MPSYGLRCSLDFEIVHLHRLTIEISLDLLAVLQLISVTYTSSLFSRILLSSLPIQDKGTITVQYTRIYLSRQNARYCCITCTGTCMRSRP